jgi:acetyltransferase
MTIRNLDCLLNPRSIALIGGSSRPGSVGRVVVDQVIAGGFGGGIYAVNPHHFQVNGISSVSSIEQLPEIPDLAIVMTPAPAVPDVIARLGKLGTKAAVVISAGLTRSNGLRQAMLDAARPHLLRVVGPNCLGVLMPRARLNASFSRASARPGRLALISQSGALVTAILDWAETRGIGFAGVVSAGDMADVDFGDLIDLFATDPGTDAILLYVEGVTEAAKFMSAARAAARIKPVIAIKAGRSAEAGKAAMSHTGALAGSYEVYRAAFDRAGIIMVETLTELFDAAELLCKLRSVGGDRLAIVTNGGGAGILAVDALGGTGGRLAALSEATIAALDDALPASWSHGNPVDLIGDADAERYRTAIRLLLGEQGADALLVMNCPTALASSADIARAVAAEVAEHRERRQPKPVLACWLGDRNSAEARELLSAADIPLYGTPDDAVRAFGYLLAARKASGALAETPPARQDIPADVTAARGIIAAARAEGRTSLSEVEAKALLAAYGIPVVRTRLAPSAEAVTEACAGLTAPFAVKIVSPQISHKSDVGGVALDLSDPDAAVAAARAMGERIGREHPEAAITGFAVEEMCVRPGAHEVIAGIADDATFGPLLMVGEGGKAVEVVRDKALALPPLDPGAARALIGRTRMVKLLEGYRDVPAADIAGVAKALDALSAMTVDLPHIMELDINPLLVDPAGVIALDARVRITAEPEPRSRLSIRPVPLEWSARLVTRTGLQLHVRPVRPEDEALLMEFFTHVTSEDLRFRFLTGLRIVDRERIVAMTQVDYRRSITFLAFAEDDETPIAAATLVADADRTRAELALATRSDMKRQGVSWTLLQHVLRYAEAERIGSVEAIESADHEDALRMERELGFTVSTDPDDPTLRIVRRTMGQPLERGQARLPADPPK